jgi:hypothetical protein
MASKGYGNVDDKGFVSAAEAFEQGAWKEISIKKHDSEEMIALPPFASTPLAIKWKLAGLWGIRRLVACFAVF